MTAGPGFRLRGSVVEMAPGSTWSSRPAVDDTGAGGDAPDGPWFEDFGSFKICGEGKYPKTFLLRGQAAKGKGL